MKIGGGDALLRGLSGEQKVDLLYALLQPVPMSLVMGQGEFHLGQILARVKGLYLALCDDDFVIAEKSPRPAWEHKVRWTLQAQARRGWVQNLKSEGKWGYWKVEDVQEDLLAGG